jgi:hypothetical protein
MLRRSQELPTGSRLPGFVQTVRYTFDQPRFFASLRARCGDTWTLRLPGFPPMVITPDRDAVARIGITLVPANQGQLHVAPVPAVARSAAAGVAH